MKLSNEKLRLGDWMGSFQQDTLPACPVCGKKLYIADELYTIKCTNCDYILTN